MKYQNNLEKEFAESLKALLIRYNIKIEYYNDGGGLDDSCFWNGSNNKNDQIFVSMLDIKEIL